MNIDHVQALLSDGVMPLAIALAAATAALLVIGAGYATVKIYEAVTGKTVSIVIS